MATFGLDDALIKRLKKEIDIQSVRIDQPSDFFFLPQLDAIYLHCGEELIEKVASRLKSSTYAPMPAIEMEVPKSSRLSARTTSIVPPSYFRPGSVLLPEDRVVYHFLGQEASLIIEKAIDRSKVMSNRPLKIKGKGFSPASLQWEKLKTEFENEIKKGSYSLVLRCDVSQYFFSINQHELVNQLEHQGLETEITRFLEKFLSGLTLDRSSRGIIQGVYGSDVIGNGYLIALDEFITEAGHPHFRYVDDIYILFETADQFRSFFPEFVKQLRDYDLGLNEYKSFVSQPSKLLQEETELDKAIEAAKEEAIEELTDYEEVEIETGPYGETATELLETEPDEEEVELEATRSIFDSLDDFKGEERHRAESFCLNIFRRAGDPIAISYVLKRWLRNPERAREYAFYLNRFAASKNHRKAIDVRFVADAEQMIDFQWAWAAIVMRRFDKISENLFQIANKIVSDGSRHEVIRSLLVYSVAKHGTPQQKKKLRDSYANAPILMQLSIIHSAKNFTSGERNAFLKTAVTHGDLQSLMVSAFKAEQKAQNKN